MVSYTLAAISAVDSIVTITDVLRPQGRLRLDEVCHQLSAPYILKNLDGHSSASQEIFFPEEGSVRADDDPRNTGEELLSSGTTPGIRRALAVPSDRPVARGRKSEV
jgi:hypothetical protein